MRNVVLNKKSKLIVLTTIVFIFFLGTMASAKSLYDCQSPRPEMAGFHNMVIFGHPADQLFAYHLPLFPGDTNGMSGHVNMHMYQALWAVELDSSTKSAYTEKFAQEKTETQPIPFFTMGPKGKAFKVPEMICAPDFSLQAQVVFGHIESNPNFPRPEVLVNQLSQIKVVGDPVFARRFDESSKAQLTYYIFGTPKQYYMAHFLTDDESSFDQILAIEIQNDVFKKQISEQGTLFVSLPLSEKNNLVPVQENIRGSSVNNKFKISASPLGQIFTVIEVNSKVQTEVSITAEIYFNKDGDLQK